MRLWPAALAWLLLFTVPGAAQGVAQGITASKPWVRYLLPAIPASGYMTLHNEGEADATLTGAASPACGSLMLHESQNTSGTAMMMDVPAVTIPAHGSISFAPGGYHLMCMAPKMRVGGNVALTLMFKSGFELHVTAPVYGATSAP